MHAKEVEGNCNIQRRFLKAARKMGSCKFFSPYLYASSRSSLFVPPSVLSPLNHIEPPCLRNLNSSHHLFQAIVQMKRDRNQEYIIMTWQGTLLELQNLRYRWRRGINALMCLTAITVGLHFSFSNPRHQAPWSYGVEHLLAISGEQSTQQNSHPIYR